tara:strand:+ start:759 stop:1085 length:327 start_codon:yes stop_codon:yes gene_type:complete
MKKFKLNGYSTWSDVMKNNKITDIQDPVLEMEMGKQEFDDIYKEILYELEGNDDVLESYIDYYFTINPMKAYVLSFRGEKEKNEFYNIGLEKKSVLSLTEIHEGEIKM